MAKKKSSSHEENLSRAATKLEELLTCGNERVELSAAKEILSIAEAQASLKNKETEGTVRLEVEIKIVE